jgi:hypothetical protein
VWWKHIGFVVSHKALAEAAIDKPGLQDKLVSPVIKPNQSPSPFVFRQADKSHGAFV